MTTEQKFQQVKIKEFASKFPSETWGKIKEEYNTITRFPNLIHETIIFCDEFYLKKELQDKIPKNIETTNTKNGKLRYIVDGILCTPTSIICVFSCRSCLEKFKVEYNPARLHLDSFLCRWCKKSVLHSCDEYRKNYEASMLASYGCKRPLQSTSIMEKFKNSMIQKYGVPFSGLSADLLEKTRKNIKFNGQSKIEQSFYLEISKRFPEWKLEQDKTLKIVCGGKTLYPDVLVNGQFVIEFYGDYWHGNPKLYEAEDFIGNQQVCKIWEQDKQREKTIREAGYFFFSIWEQDWKKQKEQKINEIKNFIEDGTKFLAAKQQDNNKS